MRPIVALGLVGCLGSGFARASSWVPPEGWTAVVDTEGERYRWSPGGSAHRMEVLRTVASRLPSSGRGDQPAALARWLDEQVRRDAPLQAEVANCMPAVIRQLGALRAVAVSQCTGRDRQQAPMRVQYFGIAGPADDGAQRSVQTSVVLVRVIAVGDDAGLAAQRPQLDAVMSHLLWPPQ